VGSPFPSPTILRLTVTRFQQLLVQQVKQVGLLHSLAWGIARLQLFLFTQQEPILKLAILLHRQALHLLVFLLVAPHLAVVTPTRIQLLALRVKVVHKFQVRVVPQVAQLVAVIGTEIAMFIVHKPVTTTVAYLQQQRALHSV
jgi:hypothetical protein